MLIHYVEFDTPGVFMPETKVRRVVTRIPAKIGKVPRHTYAIEYFDREEVKKNGEVLYGEAKNRSIRIIFGKVFEKEQLRAEGFNERSPLWHNADNTDGKVIKCITNNWQPWDKDWIVLSRYSGMKHLTNAI